ncbi:hypothetical protein [Bradyrhizobium iriomotense]|uniref:hypothetical protein n=1 Tax=Bradyrhizobium iriomotense TaxID=441950 RepID=UPI001B8A17F2|nr:hypothetical protein [Bradyrhizobium iriomotense]MBR0786204.1 hypothetical protein [Bradyrhizobium iriomotense]
MRTHATISGSELLLSVIAIRLAVLVVVGWSLTLLPQQARNSEIACGPSSVARIEAKIVGPRIVDAALDDMLRHD